jgi:hypothetical protein
MSKNRFAKAKENEGEWRKNLSREKFFLSPQKKLKELN